MITKTNNRTTVFYYAVIVFLSLGFFTGYVFIASKSFFFQDDFGFLLPVVFKQLLVFPEVAEVHNFRPVSRELFFLVSYHLFGKASFGFYCINIAAHVLSAICLFFILVKLKLSHKLSALVVFLFFANVAAFEKIAWISNFQHTSYQLFLLLAALLAIHSTEQYGINRILSVSLSVISWVLSIFSNIAGLFFPFIVVLLLYIKLRHDNDDNFKKILSSITKITFAHWIVFFMYVIFMLSHWKRTDISDPYYVDLTIKTFFDNISYYYRKALITNASDIFLIPVVILYVLFIVSPIIRQVFLKKVSVINMFIIVGIFCLLYMPFAFLKYQRYANYVSLALIPWYVMILYPLFNDFTVQKGSSNFIRFLGVFSLIILTISFLPNKKHYLYYFKDSPKLHIKSIWDQTQYLLPNIPHGVQKVIFIDQERAESRHSTEVPVWKIPPFWWHVGHGTMFAIIYGKLIKFEVVKEKPAIQERDSIYIMVDKGPIYYSLSLPK